VVEASTNTIRKRKSKMNFGLLQKCIPILNQIQKLHYHSKNKITTQSLCLFEASNFHTSLQAKVQLPC
jgi:hypothetical protein